MDDAKHHGHTNRGGWVEVLMANPRFDALAAGALCLALASCEPSDTANAVFAKATTLPVAPSSIGLPPDSHAPRTIALTCLDGHNVRDELKSATGPTNLRDACAAEVELAVGDWGVGQPLKDAVFVTMLAYRAAPYGASRSVTLDALLNDPVLDCDNYILLAGYLLQALHPEASLDYVGFDGGTVGNHSEAFFVDGDSTVFMDPTVGIAALDDFDTLLMGRELAARRVVIDGRQPEAAVKGLSDRVLQGLLKGNYRPSDLLYFFRGRDEMFAFSEHGADLWMSAHYRELLLHYPTPGARSLRTTLLRSVEFQPGSPIKTAPSP